MRDLEGAPEALRLRLHEEGVPPLDPALQGQRLTECHTADFGRLGGAVFGMHGNGDEQEGGGKSHRDAGPPHRIESGHTRICSEEFVDVLPEAMRRGAAATVSSAFPQGSRNPRLSPPPL